MKELRRRQEELTRAIAENEERELSLLRKSEERMEDVRRENKERHHLKNEILRQIL